MNACKRPKATRTKPTRSIKAPAWRFKAKATRPKAKAKAKAKTTEATPIDMVDTKSDDEHRQKKQVLQQLIGEASAAATSAAASADGFANRLQNLGIPFESSEEDEVGFVHVSSDSSFDVVPTPTVQQPTVDV